MNAIKSKKLEDQLCQTVKTEEEFVDEISNLNRELENIISYNINEIIGE